MSDLNLEVSKGKSRNALEAIGIGKDFLSRTQVAQQLRERMEKWDYMKLSLLHNKRNDL
jgi:hypothetical protein